MFLPPVVVLVLLILAGQAAQAQQPDVVAGDSRASSQLWCTWTPSGATDVAPGGAAGRGKTIVFISGDEEYRSEEALPMLGKLLARRHGFTCHCLFAVDPDSGMIDPRVQTNIPGMHLLEEADLVVMALRFRHLPDEQMKYFDQYLMSGHPIIALRTSTHAFRYPDDSDSEFARYGWNSTEWPGGFGRQVLGESWVSHHGDHGKQSTRAIINPDHAGHVVLTGVEDVWGPTDVYGIRDLPDNARILMHGQVLDGMSPDSPPAETSHNDPMMPLAWLRDWQTESGATSRIFCTTMGAATDFESADLRRLIVNAVFLLAGLESVIDGSLDVTPLGTYEPSEFGFDRFQKGVRPADIQARNASE